MIRPTDKTFLIRNVPSARIGDTKAVVITVATALAFPNPLTRDNSNKCLIPNKGS